MVAHGLLAILFHLVGVIETKVGTRDLDVLNGLMSPVEVCPNKCSLVLEWLVLVSLVWQALSPKS